MAKYNLRDETPGAEQGPWVLDLDRLMMDEAIELQKLTGMSPRAWVDALAQDDPLAVRYAFYIARKRADDEVAFRDVNVNLFAMSIEEIPEPGAELPDPTAGMDEETAALVPTGPPTSDEDQT